MITASTTLAAPTAPQTCTYHEVACASLSPADTEQAVWLACQLGAPAGYILSRIKHYDTLQIYRKGGRLVAFQLVQQFVRGNTVYVYHGPAFSRGGAFLPLFVRYLTGLAGRHPGKTIYLLAEIQNPKMLMIMHGLMGAYGYSFLSKKIPARIRKAVPVFCSRYGHIGRYNPQNFTTSSGYSLYRETRDCDPLTSLLTHHQISLSGGDNLLFAAKLPASAAQREKLLQQVSQGALTVANWEDYKHTFLAKLEKTRS